MSAGSIRSTVTAPVASILVVDDDRRVRELLEIALTAHGFGVLTAADGDEAVKRAIANRPDLIVLDVRLPKKSGLEVCEILRRDPEDPGVPIILVSAQAETDARLQAFSRGADDYMPKPFSPKELVARIKRLLSRSAEARTAVRRAQELERELVHARDDARRAHEDSRREQRLREIATGLGRDLLDAPDLDALAQRLLMAVQSKLRIGWAGLLVRDHPQRGLRICAVRGDGFERLAPIELAPGGELATVLAGLARPVLRAELERMPHLRAELAPFVACGIDLLAPLAGPDGLEGLVVTDERLDATGHVRSDLEILAGLCEIGALAIRNAQRQQWQAEPLIALAAERTPADAASDAFRAEAASILGRVGRAMPIHPRLCESIRLGVIFGSWGLCAEGRLALEHVRPLDSSGSIASLLRLFARAADPGRGPDAWSPEEQRAALLLRAGIDYAQRRSRGEAVTPAMEAALAGIGPALDEATRHAVIESAHEHCLLHRARPRRRSA